MLDAHCAGIQHWQNSDAKGQHKMNDMSFSRHREPV